MNYFKIKFFPNQFFFNADISLIKIKFQQISLFIKNLQFLLSPKQSFIKKKNLIKTKQILLVQSNGKNKLSNLNFFFSFYFSNKNHFFTFLKFSVLLTNQLFTLNKIKFSIYTFLLKFFGEGFFYIRGLFLIFFLDSLVTDDEPLWEPIEWSLVQTWIFFIFLFAWIAENLITSRYGSYTGRDKRVWLAWYKTFWLIEIWYALSFGATAMFVIVPFYYELTYTVSFVFSWWNWYNRIFFFKFISLLTTVLFLAYFLQLSIKWLNWKKHIILIALVCTFILYLLYTQFIISFFSYFTDPLWYQKTRFIDYVQLSHEPLKWGWGSAKRDHFTYHKVSTVFWYKNDGPFAAAFLLINLFFFLSIFLLCLYWIVLLRKTFATKETSFTFTVCCISALKQFFILFFLFYALIFISFIVCYWRFPIEFYWSVNANLWILSFLKIIANYFNFLISMFFY